MEQDIKSAYQRISDKISYEDFLMRIEEMKKEYDDIDFMDELDIVNMIVENLSGKKNIPLTDEKEEKKPKKIASLELGKQNQTLIGRIMSISHTKTFKRKKVDPKKPEELGKVANIKVADDTGEIKVVLWNEKTKKLENLKEGDLVRVIDVDIREGFRGDEEAHLNPRSTIKKLDEDGFDNLPKYKENITPIAEIKSEMQVNVIARIIRISRTRTFNSNGREGKFVIIDLKDDTGSISLTLWNKDVNIISESNLSEGDSVKILGARSRERNNEISLNHSWDGRIIKGDFDVPEHEEEIIKIGDAHEMKGVTLTGIVTKIQDTINFQRSDNSLGHVKSIVIADDTGEMKVTLWNEDTKLKINKGDILKITDGNVEFDDYSQGYRVNTNWNSKIDINPEDDKGLKDILEEHKKELEPLKIEEIKEIEDEGADVDILGRIIEAYEANEFQRVDGTVGKVRSVVIADGTGSIRLSFWDDKANLELETGDPIKIENAKTRFRDDQVELNIGKTTRVLKPDENVPTMDEIEKSLYLNKKIEEIEENDKNIKVSGTIEDINGDRILYEMCPNCNKRVQFVDDAFICDFCGEKIEKPDYLMIIPCRIKDETGDITVTFFRKQAEELLGMTTDEANEVIAKTADEGSLADKVEERIGSEITVIADANFDDYNEEIRLIARKIVKIEY